MTPEEENQRLRSLLSYTLLYVPTMGDIRGWPARRGVEAAAVRLFWGDMEALKPVARHVYHEFEGSKL